MNWWLKWRAARMNCCRRRWSSRQSAIALPANELLDAAIRFVVGHLDGRMLGKIGGGGMQHAPDPAIERKFAAANRVNGHARRVRRILNRKFHIDLHRHIAEEPAFHAD